MPVKYNEAYQNRLESFLDRIKQEFETEFGSDHHLAVITIHNIVGSMQFVGVKTTLPHDHLAPFLESVVLTQQQQQNMEKVKKDS